MAKRQKKFEEDHSNDWLNTYADMVTLLLTFFVMLYASSSIDDQKWQYIYQAFQSRGKFLNEYVRSPDPVAENGEGVTDDNPNTNGGDGEMPQSFDKLYVFLSEYVEENDLSDQIAVDQGAAHITIRFDDDIFFDPYLHRNGSHRCGDIRRERLESFVGARKQCCYFLGISQFSSHK